MENLSMLLQGFSVVLTFENVLVCLIATNLGSGICECRADKNAMRG